MGIEEMTLLACELVYLVNLNADTETAVKQCAKCMENQKTQPAEKTMPNEMPYKPLDQVGADISSITNIMVLCIVDYYSNFPVL